MTKPDVTPEMIPVDFPEPVLRDGWTRERLLDLGKSLLVKPLNPIYVMRNKKVVAGNSRIIAARMVKLSDLPGYWLDANLSEQEQLQWICFENVHRLDMTVQEQVKNCQRLQELNPDWDQKRVAGFLKLDPSMVTRLLSVGRVLPAVAEAFYAGGLSLSAVYEISKCEPAEMHEALAQALGGASREQIRQIRETRTRKRNGTVPSVKVNRVRVPLKSGLSVVVSGASVSLEDFVDACAEGVKEAKAAIKRGENAKSFQQVMSDRTKAE